MKKKFTIYLVIFSMLAVSSFLPSLVKNANAAAMTVIGDTISTSEPSVLSNHSVKFITATSIPTSGKILITYPSTFGNIANTDITCPSGFSVSGTDGDKIVECTASGAYSPTSTVITFNNVTNAAAVDSYKINIETQDATSNVLDTGIAMIAIVDTVQVTATVEPTLDFEIHPVATSTNVNGAITTASSTVTSLEFGTLAIGASSTMAQSLTVVTNATDGYVVTVEQNQNLTSAGGDDIDSFLDGTPPVGAAQAWVSPAGTLDSEETYGHFGITSEDDSLTSGDDFGDALYRGFNGTSTMEVMYHNGPADGSTASKGETKVAYTIEISPLQEAGDYSNTLTYICTPTF